MERKNRLGVQTQTGKFCQPRQGEIFVKTIPMNFQAPSGATSCLAAKNMPLLTELFQLAIVILQNRLRLR
jgi:hypothetical protein